MLKQIFGSRPTTRIDVVLGYAAAAMAVISAINIHHQFNNESEEDPK